MSFGAFQQRRKARVKEGGVMREAVCCWKGKGGAGGGGEWEGGLRMETAGELGLTASCRTHISDQHTVRHWRKKENVFVFC